MGFFTKIFGDPHAREVKKLWRYVEEVQYYEDQMKGLTETQFREQTAQFMKRVIEGGESLDDLLPEAFAAAKEAAWRTLGMRPFDVQVIGGVVMHQGRIAEMKTGEGKTLAATLPAYLNALSGKGVHIVTVNDYLAGRDQEWMGSIYRYLGLNVGLIVHDLTPQQRREAYGADITYGTNNELGFDFLRDNMVIYKDQMVQRRLNYAIVDEVDSILIDEARTPLIISGAAEKATELYGKFAAFVPRLRAQEHYTVDEKAHTVALTDEGTIKAEAFLKVDNLSDEENMELSHHLNQALKAHVLMKRDRDYVVKDGEVVIVDEFTGRLMFGRRYSEGLHQAIEAKEKVKVARESRTLASITFQNYFRMYDKIAGMTGTAVTEEEEFRKIYGMDVVIIPTNKNMIRDDCPDAVYRTEKGKFQSVVEEIVHVHETGQPILVGTISIEKSEHLSGMLSRRGVRHHVLNAKHHDKEAEIVSQAGKLKAVTIATNMAGRGTDIILGGNPERELELLEGKQELTEEQKDEQRKRIREQWQKDHQQVIDLGGLYIMGTERHESRRIDNQLRGRSGRQGDPGTSRFFVSLEDDLMRLFGSDNVMSIMEKLGMEENLPVEHPMISKAIENAQKKVEGRNFEIRKHILEYDDVLNQQRGIIYKQRRQVMEGDDLKNNILEMIPEVVKGALEIYAGEKVYPEDWDLAGLIGFGERVFLPVGVLKAEDLAGLSRGTLAEMLIEEANKFYAQREEVIGSEVMRELERVILLRAVDGKWMEHIDTMHELRQGVGLRAYGQQNPLIEYKRESFDMFQEMIHTIQEDVVRLILHVQVNKSPERQKNAAAADMATIKRQDSGAMGEARGEYSGDRSSGPVKQTPITVKKVGRNDLCPCGSGKKYKKCCGVAE